MNSQISPISALAEALAQCIADGSFVKAVLSKYRGAEPGLQRIDLRLVSLRNEPRLQFVYHHATRDITRNHPVAEGVSLVRELLGPGSFRAAHLHTSNGVQELSITQRGQAHLRHEARPGPLPSLPNDAGATGQPAGGAVAGQSGQAHNREKHRMLPMDRPFLTALGVTTPQHTVVPAMARKWKQINKFLEVFASALTSSGLSDAGRLNVIDFGSGKGYLTFAIHDWLTHAKQVDAQVTGVELRPDMVSLCNAAIERLGLAGLRIEQGDVRSWQPAALDVMIALHACDTATDHAIDLGLRGGAQIILCSPCCHKQIRPQLLSPHPLRPILQHGVHLGQEAEMLTDGLRALLLEAAGYDTQVFEFISLEHTNKNKMILAVKRAQPRPAAPVLAQIAEVKNFYGIREHCLETLLAGRLKQHDEVVADNPA